MLVPGQLGMHELHIDRTLNNKGAFSDLGEHGRVVLVITHVCELREESRGEGIGSGALTLLRDIDDVFSVCGRNSRLVDDWKLQLARAREWAWSLT